ncbi:MAG: divergent polysaccharide deacetylase family protein, partial [Nitrospira sp.]|nr:divergent polysaccharide deacetylase family protein [Nitrospira sp.]
HRQPGKPILVQKLEKPAPIEPEPVNPEPLKPESVPEETHPKYKAKIAIVIDDLGYDNNVFRKFVALGVPITFSILPGERYSVTIAKSARKLNYETMLHLPMEPQSILKNPGRWVILHDMSREEMLKQLSKDIKAVPNISGVNNHMGSLLTEDSNAMNIVLGEIRKKGLYFLDSKTTANSKAYQIAKSLGMKSGSRDVFLDNNDDVGYIKGQIDIAIRMAKRKGEATVIGHPRVETVAALRAKVSDFKREGIKLVPLSEVLN